MFHMDEKFFETKNNTYAQRKTNKYCIMLLKTAISTLYLDPSTTKLSVKEFTKRSLCSSSY